VSKEEGREVPGNKNTTICENGREGTTGIVYTKLVCAGAADGVRMGAWPVGIRPKSWGRACSAIIVIVPC
jgi:hypothetical protein